MKRFALALLTCLGSASVFATPISYTTLQDNVPVFSEISPFSGTSTPNTAQYFRFFVTTTQQVSITGTRVDMGYDMSFWLLSGLFSDTDQFGSMIDNSDAPFVAFRDDDVAAPGGLFADPQFIGTLNGGWYTIAVTNYASSGNTGPDNMYDFRLLASNLGGGTIPEPASLGLLGLGLLAVCVVRRSK